MTRPPFEVADVIRIAGDRFRERSSAALTWPQHKVLDAIARCRTAALPVPLRCFVSRAFVFKKYCSVWSNVRIVRYIQKFHDVLLLFQIQRDRGGMLNRSAGARDRDRVGIAGRGKCESSSATREPNRADTADGEHRYDSERARETMTSSHAEKSETEQSEGDGEEAR
jgi:hypothetical protein